MTEGSQKAEQYLSRFLEKPLRVQISDGRMFTGAMKCVDKVPDTIIPGV